MDKSNKRFVKMFVFAVVMTFSVCITPVAIEHQPDWRGVWSGGQYIVFMALGLLLFMWDE